MHALSHSRSCSFSVALSVLYPHGGWAAAPFRPSSRQGLMFVLLRSAPRAAPCWSAGIPVACEVLPTEIREAGDRPPRGQRLGGPPGCSRVSEVRIGKQRVTPATLFSHPTGEENAEPLSVAGGMHSAAAAPWPWDLRPLGLPGLPAFFPDGISENLGTSAEGRRKDQRREVSYPRSQRMPLQLSCLQYTARLCLHIDL